MRLAALICATDPEDVAQEAFCRVFVARSRPHNMSDGSRDMISGVTSRP
ncbi:MAG: hypothetical protein H0V48_00480 [Nocardioidaceae bacterium]|nr:hypothetical protein [Nocardioidaceae bacterium]